MALDPEHIESFFPLIRAMIKLCGHRPNRLLDTEDFFQEAALALLEVWRRHGTAPQPDSHYYQIIQSGCIEAYRRVGLTARRTGARKEPEPLVMVPIENVAGELRAESLLDEEILNKELVAYIEQLPIHDVRLFTLLLDDVSQHAIAREWGCTDGFVSQCRTRGVHQLRALMEG